MLQKRNVLDMESVEMMARVFVNLIDWVLRAKFENAPPALAYHVLDMVNVRMELVSANLDGAVPTVTTLRAPDHRSAVVVAPASKVLASAILDGLVQNVPPRLSAHPYRLARGPRCVLDLPTACATPSLECASVCRDIRGRTVVSSWRSVTVDPDGPSVDSTALLCAISDA